MRLTPCTLVASLVVAGLAATPAKGQETETTFSSELTMHPKKAGMSAHPRGVELEGTRVSELSRAPSNRL